MALLTPFVGKTGSFQLKLIEILEKGFRQKAHYDYVADVELSRTAYKINEAEVAYFVMRALLCLPSLVVSVDFLKALKEILQFYQTTLMKLINGYVPKMKCLKAIEDANAWSEHLKYKETSAFLVHFLTVSNILDGDTVMQFYQQLQERQSYLVTQNSFRMMITWLQDEAAKKRLEERRRLIQWSEADDDIPISQLLMRSIERAFNVKPLCVWAMRGEDRVAFQNYKPLLVLVRKNLAEVANNDADELFEEEDNPNDDPQNENEENPQGENQQNEYEAEYPQNEYEDEYPQNEDEDEDQQNEYEEENPQNEHAEENPEQHYGEVEQSDVEDQDEDEEDEMMDSDENDDVPLEYLKNMVKSMKQVHQ